MKKFKIYWDNHIAIFTGSGLELNDYLEGISINFKKLPLSVEVI